MQIVDGKKFRKVVGEPSWITPEILATYQGSSSDIRQAQLTYGLIGEDLDIWGVVIVDIKAKKLIKALAFDNIKEALTFLKKSLK